MRCSWWLARSACSCRLSRLCRRCRACLGCRFARASARASRQPLRSLHMVDMRSVVVPTATRVGLASVCLVLGVASSCDRPDNTGHDPIRTAGRADRQMEPGHRAADLSAREVRVGRLVVEDGKGRPRFVLDGDAGLKMLAEDGVPVLHMRHQVGQTGELFSAHFGRATVQPGPDGGPAWINHMRLTVANGIPVITLSDEGHVLHLTAGRGIEISPRK